MSSPADLIRQHLEGAGLPPGLLPKDVTEVRFNDTGSFTITLPKATKADVQGFTVLYAQQISGSLSDGAIRNLKGVQVKIALLKPAVTEIQRSPSGEKVVFSVGSMKKAFPKSVFA